jgi:hypothetical protein
MEMESMIQTLSFKHNDHREDSPENISPPPQKKRKKSKTKKKKKKRKSKNLYQCKVPKSNYSYFIKRAKET